MACPPWEMDYHQRRISHSPWRIRYPPWKINHLQLRTEFMPWRKVYRRWKMVYFPWRMEHHPWKMVYLLWQMDRPPWRPPCQGAAPIRRASLPLRRPGRCVVIGDDRLYRKCSGRLYRSTGCGSPRWISDKVIARKEYTGLRGHFVRIQGAITGA
uniref:Uncharacterized protein n=1 Tax=Candidatus Kentrum sp. FM TaxID=2126340 RepID=A0A450S1U8_9GAMM|nr:MAG: hypothetical protein BECKFM1743A_GA0114220_100275 [Candidatus Kentron sp. FM]VFJ49436.1 MAG: hypothetical protein BECKFM1743C_GA0114222_100715 [Candidatus Kentron sp. FM]VFK20009.1 MAG: hypothetical protein BECKFM1743B_GA0114221_106624 [Candidatus Kentron sp. FM]